MILNLFMVKFYQGDNQAADLVYKSTHKTGIWCPADSTEGNKDSEQTELLSSIVLTSC